VRITMDTGVLSAEERPVMDALRTRIIREFEGALQHMDSMKLRALVREYLLALDAVQLKPSVYFVPKEHMDEVERLAQLLKLWGNGSGMHTLPLVDLPAQRQEVIESFQTEAEFNLRALVGEISELRQTGKTVTPAQFGRMKERYDAVAQKARNYTERLDLTQDRTGAALEIAQHSLMALHELAAEGVAAKDSAR
jgi:hypothetical protein